MANSKDNSNKGFSAGGNKDQQVSKNAGSSNKSDVSRKGSSSSSSGSGKNQSQQNMNRSDSGRKGESTH
jgi:hypothetical protein